MKNLLTKIQELPELKKKVIFWTLIITIALVLLIFNIKNVQKRFKNLKLDEFKEGISLPKIEIPKIDEILKIQK